jgi:cellulose synthase/poly-beta-1,6-N-acetylglucosamine synthase-like glycosyltransferase
VFVDNGSTDGTLAYLRSLDGVIVIENDRNLGFGGGCNQGIAASLGERVLLLNNDVVVTAGWLAALHAALDANPKVGLVGPRSNRVAGTQQVDEVGYDVETLEGLDAWAASWCAEHRGMASDIPRLVGFCILARREVLERIGGFDLRFGLGNFEDDDFCMRALVAGWQLRVVHDSWIHHIGSRTFSGEGIDYRATLAENLMRFAATWRLQDEDIDPQTGAYRPDRITDTPYDAARHLAPLIGEPDDGSRVDLHGARARVLAVCCDAVDPAATRESLDAALQAFGPDDDVTVAVRIAAGDSGSMALLESVADGVGDDALPDIAVVSSEHDLPLLRAADAVLVHGRLEWARAQLARWSDRRALRVHELRSLLEPDAVR